VECGFAIVGKETGAMEYWSVGVVRFRILARPGADLEIVSRTFLQTNTKYTALTMWSVWAREFGLRIIGF
jgi:hypothetical protein